MKLHRNVPKMMARPAWIGLIVISILCASGAALWIGLQQDAGETSTTYLFGRRVGYLNRPLPVLDDHLNEIVNSVEFPVVFERIEERLLLQAEKDYDLSIGVVEDTQSLVEIEVRTNRSGEADRIARIVAEEMVEFVLDTQDLSISTEISDLDGEISRLQDEQERLVSLSGNVPPTRLKTEIEQQLAGLLANDDGTPVGTLEGLLQEQLIAVTPLANEYRRNTININRLQQDRAQAIVERSDLLASQASINQEWYRSITPVEPTSNVPVAIAMAFAAAVPAGLSSTALVGLNLNRRLNRRDKLIASGA